MKRPRCGRILANMTFAVILAALLNVVAKGDDLTAVPTGASPAAQDSMETSPSPTAPASELPAATIDATPAKSTEPASAIEQSVVSDPLASLDPADRVVAEKIRDLLAAKSDAIFASKSERKAVESFYQSRTFPPLWLDRGVPNARATAVIARLKEADADGLEASDYRTPNFTGLGPDALAEADLKLTQTMLTFARHLQAGRFPYKRVSQNNIQLPQAPPEPAAILEKIVNATDAGKTLDEFSPPHEAYQKLKVKLAEMRAKSAGARSEVADGPELRHTVKDPMQDPRVPLLREKFGLPGDKSDLTYDAELAAAVRKFQQANDLPATGYLDARTVKELNRPIRDKQINLVIANMERWRWYPRDLGAANVIVNQPDFTLKVVHNGSQIWATRVVIGSPSPGKQTPLLSETMRSVTVNPTWNVPPSIMYNEYMPALARDPTVLARMGLNVTYGPDGSVHVSQPPGGANVLGRLRFNFPNRFLVYQHDTNERFMFAREVRAYSHGCMRVQDPAKYAEILLNIARPSEHWTVEKVKQMFGRGEQDLQLQSAQIWVHVTYQSAFVDDTGKLQVRGDVYNLDSRTIAAIKSERGIIETVPEGKSEQVIASGSRSHRVSTPRPVSFFPSFFFGGRPLRPPREAYYRRGWW
jgi:murein L,D-transpeptidase YcbB/YkuD